jgi:glycosyltransferase involved in cell wall biosynthesis
MLKSSSARSLHTQYSFLNPFLNHSYFTLRALSQHGSVFLFCPPLQLQLILGTWRYEAVTIAPPPVLSKLYSILAIGFFCLFKLRLINECIYLLLFRALALLYLKQITPFPTLVYYQDYLADTLFREFPNTRRICELIINSTPGQVNYESTLRACVCSTSVVTPTTELYHLCGRSSHPPILAPYGGDKILYLAHTPQSNVYPIFSPYSHLEDHSPPIKHYKIAARAHSHRKGLDILLGALLSLERWLSSSSSSFKLEITIYGKVTEVLLCDLFANVSNALAYRGLIHLKCEQLPMSLYLDRLAQSDLFIMPSRLESSSLAALEALWHGIPSILTEACGIRSFSEPKHGILLRQLSVTELSFSIQKLLESPDRLQECKQNLLSDRHMFTWNQYFTSYTQLLLRDQ